MRGVPRCDQKMLSLLLELSLKGLLFKDIAVRLAINPSMVTTWLKRFFPEEYARRKEIRGKWRTKYLEPLRKACEDGLTFDEIGDLFGVPYITARFWIEKHLGEEMLACVSRKTNSYPQEVKDQAVVMRRAGSTLEQIKDALGVRNAGSVSQWCAGVERGESLPQDDFCSEDGVGRGEESVADGPTTEELDVIEEELTAYDHYGVSDFLGL